MGAVELAVSVNTFLEPLVALGDYRLIAFGSALLFLGLKVTLRDFWGVHWFSLLHASIVGPGALLCCYFDYYASQIDSLGISEPLRTIRCAPPLTALHSLLPVITLGYSLSDLFDGLATGKKDFILHGVSVGSCMLVLCELGLPHLVVSGLVMDISSIPLNLLHAKVSPKTSLAINLSFVLSFFAVRILLVPYIWIGWMMGFYGEAEPPPCFPSYFIYLVIGFGLLFNGLNVFWFFKIIRKVRRQLAGSSEGAKAKAP